ncbi:carbohydrate ABC transporter permease [Paenibacillus mucilaginosus]|uniref:Binding-protein-dependent transport system inner membrane component n=3 Tax=Paenibacillus mucilaginosus TaxID=61624 RepID=H6NMZ6_9BACL|nr:sugar ABC transporter permease [Paenibacillus mucilaginosus]AEI43383.1 binding-protein-dependent transport system inner membrane component [Paenibacillus mucilaginosus KNP414]AFC31036.1 binding-protein-dependent transport system inner membrane component [Paenibacillus mucilaginosus 3016]AFH63354.2 sugar ABC transporter permease [Paenibacillus mucilaginosus K02]MCG7212069.1 sugar ABC transporter permease [Paenibacillus mucilaginosus]WDM24947.1 sugar ABC transporter permease [Paenibacillus mu
MSITKRLYSYYLLLPALLIYVVFYVLPTLIGLFYSFTDWRLDSETIEFNGLYNFERIFTDETLLLAIKNTIIFAVVTVIGKNVLAILLAVALNMNLKTRNALRAIFYAPSIVSVLVISLLFTPMLRSEGLLNGILDAVGLDFLMMSWLTDPSIIMLTISGLSIWQYTGFQMAIYLAGLQSISKDYYEAARIDGAGSWSSFVHITLPLLWPAININVMLTLIGGLKVFSEVFVLTGGGPGNASQVIGTIILRAFGEGNWGLGTAVNTLLFIAVTLISIPLLLYMRRKEVQE